MHSTAVRKCCHARQCHCDSIKLRRHWSVPDWQYSLIGDFYPALRCTQSPPSCELFLRCPLPKKMSSVCYMLSSILTGQPYVPEDLENTDLLTLFTEICTNTLVFLPMQCCCGEKFCTLGLVLCNIVNKCRLLGCLHFHMLNWELGW